jgi:hypothetical protein
VAAAGALLLGASYAFWYYAVEVEVYTIACLFLVLALALLLALLRRPTPSLAAALGATQGMAVLFHQTNVLLAIPALAAIYLGSRQQADGRGRLLPAPLLAAYGAPLALIVGGAYLGVGLGVSGFRSWGALYSWLTGYAQTGWWGGAIDGAKLAGLGVGLSKTLAQPGGAAVGVGLLALLLISLGGLRAAPPGAPWVLLAWLLTYGAFFLWWEPDNVEFWIASLPPFYLLLLLALAGRWPARASLAGSWPLAALGGLGLAMLLINLGAIRQRGDASTDLQRRVAAALAARSAPGDLLLPPDGLQELYLPYYSGRQEVISLNQAMTASRGDWPAACAALRVRVELALASGYALLAADDALRPVPAASGESPTPMERFRLTPDRVADCYAPLAPMLAPLDLGPGLPGYRRIPPAQELADGPGWNFTRGDWGWRAANADTKAGPGGLLLRPKVDPALSSPPLGLEAARYGAIELRLAATTAARDAQLFFLDAAGRADEGRSLRWQLAPGPEARTYRLDLRAAPGWRGTIGGLRLDPVGSGDGGTVMVESIRLLP